MAGERHMTQDHERIRDWVESRGGWPATVASTYSENDPGLIRIDFEGYSGGDSLKKITWDEWFSKFDSSDLVLLFQETLADGHLIRLFDRRTKVAREGGQEPRRGTRAS